MNVGRFVETFRHSGFGAFRCSSLLVFGIVISAPPSPQNPKIAVQTASLQVAADAPLPVSLPMSNWKELPTVDLGINTSPIERFGVDTGLNAIVIRPDAVASLQLPTLPSTVRVHVLDTYSDVPEVQIKTLRVRGMLLQNVSVATVDVPTLLTIKEHSNAPTGWLGAPFLSAFQVTFDFVSHSLTLDRAQSPFPKSKENTIVPLELKEGRPFVKVTVPGSKPFLALVDTGSRGTLIPAEVAAKLKIKPLQEITIKRADGTEGKAAIFILPKLNVGKAEWKGAQVFALLPESSKTDRTKTDNAKKESAGVSGPALAILGLDFLRRYRVTLNYGRQQMALTPPQLPETKDRPKLEGDPPI
jgi:predicted aspartyl protease